MPKNDEPIILVSNHQNGMMDPIMLCITERKQLHWLTRSDIFKNPLVAKILHNINMLPVYRPKDKDEKSKEKNELIFEESYRRIAAGNIISIFPEGNHGNKKHLRSIKTGIARIAFGAEAASNFDLNIHIIPVGIDYSDYVHFRSTILINYGDPIPIKQYEELYKSDPIKAVNELRKDVKTALSKQIIDIKDLELYPTLMGIQNVCESFLLKKQNLHHTHYNKFKVFKDLTDEIVTRKEANIELIDQLTTQTKSYQDQLIPLKIKEDNLVNYNEKNLLTKLGLIFLSPLFLIGYIFNGIPLNITNSFVKKKIKDTHFKSSIKVGLGGFVFLFFYIILFIIFSTIFNPYISLLIIVVGLTSGKIALLYSDTYKEEKAKRKIRQIDKNLLNLLLEKRKAIQETVLAILK